MKILGIETSCDETAVAVLDIKKNKVKVLSNTISSQVKLHAKYGGVVPNLAAREHVKNIEHVFKLALKEAGINHFSKEVDLIAVTRGPGLSPALLVGVIFAKTLAWKYRKPITGVNHLEGHIYSNWLPAAVNSKFKILNPKQIPNSKFQIQNKKIFPILNLIVSGGHTELVLMSNYGKYKLIGETLDDAVGEAFDKVARLLGLGYPGGPAISQRAAKWNFQFSISNFQKKSKFQIPKIVFPRPMEKSKDYNFSYSGLKTAVLYKIRDFKKAGVKITENVKNEICYEFQKAATEVLIKKTIKAAKEYGVKSVFLSGGVSANQLLRLELQKATEESGLNYSQPELEYTGDNAAMIALAGYVNYKRTKNPSLPPPTHKAAEGQRRLPPSVNFRRTSRKTTNFSWKSVKMDANISF
ncbi:MAG: putative tRNA threonylcarbamoyladenosine biosynthesis protein Gcp [Candidatus Yanofskybacteria bacterium GW2011_GWA2_44_9]|nr:MAG: putative tRNA threonylcarbamoyladenosine biosynthesis protein Gcp [Candidatus Yanofskybacteria bacterium GW2011_GWA2_44_9]